jgi:putrescine transport system substrate-binding protein
LVRNSNNFAGAVDFMNRYLWVFALSVIGLSSCGKKEEGKAADAAGAPAVAASSAVVATSTAEEKVLNIYNWPDYIAKDMVANFEKESGIKVNYQTFENNEALLAKLIAGNSGYDLVVPGAVFAKSQIEAGLLMKLDKTKLANYGNLDADIMGKLGVVDPGNAYLVPWAWSYTTVGINKALVAKALGSPALPDNAWELVFNPEYTAKLKSCGITFLDSPTEVIPPAMHFLGKNPYSSDPADHKAAGEMLARVRPHVRMFSSTMIDDLAGGKACVALGWAGDMNIARARAIENKNGNEIQVLIPSTGGLLFFDNLAIPKDAKHPGNALAFINYFMKPEVAASLTNELSYPTANKLSVASAKPEIASDKTIYLDADSLKKMVPPASFTNEGRESMSMVFTQFKKAK